MLIMHTEDDTFRVLRRTTHLTLRPIIMAMYTLEERIETAVQHGWDWDELCEVDIAYLKRIRPYND